MQMARMNVGLCPLLQFRKGKREGVRERARARFVLCVYLRMHMYF